MTFEERTPEQQGRGQCRAHARLRGFTLMEMLVVLALTAILLTLLFGPLGRSLQLVRRGSAKVVGQDNVRAAMRRVTRDLSNAMVVYEPRPLTMWGYDGITAPRGRVELPNAPVPEPYLVRNGLVAFRLPKHRYFCARGHYVTQEEVGSDLAALDTCPRHPGTPIDIRPITPLEPEPLVTAYFVGLKLTEPLSAGGRFRDAQGRPLYNNIALFRASRVPGAAAILNTYSLYRVQFDPADPRFANWHEDVNRNNTLDSGEDQDGDGLLGPNPNFFYDQRMSVAAAPFPSQPYTIWWKNATVAVMDMETGDVAKWVDVAGEWVPRPLTSFTPGVVQEEVAQPNRGVGQYLLASGAVPAELPAVEYITENGHWLGERGDGTVSIWDAALLSHTPRGTMLFGPRIQVLENRSGALVPVFDTENSALRNRIVTYDSLRGRVGFAINRKNHTAANAGNALDAEYYSAALEDYYTARLERDIQLDPNGVPSAYGPVTTMTVGPDRRYPAAMLVPGSDVVQLRVRDTATNTWSLEPMRRAGWTGLSTSLNRYVAQPDLAPDEYSIDYSSGVITLSDQDPARWTGVGPNMDRQLLVKYQFQTNRPNDVVRVSYGTREAYTVTLGVVQYTRGRGEILPFEVTDTVLMRNLKQ